MPRRLYIICVFWMLVAAWCDSDGLVLLVLLWSFGGLWLMLVLRRLYEQNGMSFSPQEKCIRATISLAMSRLALYNDAQMIDFQ